MTDCRRPGRGQERRGEERRDEQKDKRREENRPTHEREKEKRGCATMRQFRVPGCVGSQKPPLFIVFYSLLSLLIFSFSSFSPPLLLSFHTPPCLSLNGQLLSSTSPPSPCSSPLKRSPRSSYHPIAPNTTWRTHSTKTKTTWTSRRMATLRRLFLIHPPTATTTTTTMAAAMAQWTTPLHPLQLS